MTGVLRAFDIAFLDLSLILVVFAFFLSVVCVCFGRSGLLIPESISQSALDRFVAPFFGGFLFAALPCVDVFALVLDVVFGVFDLPRGFVLDVVTSSFTFFAFARSKIEFTFNIFSYFFLGYFVEHLN